jgi:hypothetical protein
LVSQCETPLRHQFQCIPLKFQEKYGPTPDDNFHLAIKDSHPYLPLLQLKDAPSLLAQKAYTSLFQLPDSDNKDHHSAIGDRNTNGENDQTLVVFDAPQANYHLLFVLCK